VTGVCRKPWHADLPLAVVALSQFSAFGRIALAAFPFVHFRSPPGFLSLFRSFDDFPAPSFKHSTVFHSSRARALRRAGALSAR
jgi:hypothetical protein